MNILRNIFSSLTKKKKTEPSDEQQIMEPDPKSVELKDLAEKYGVAGYPEVVEKQGFGIPYQFLQSKDDLHSFWSQDIMAYMISWPGAQGAPGQILIVTHRKFFYASNYCWGDLKYEDFRTILPNLPESFDDLRPWELMERNVGGWYWYGIHSGCWLRVHESVWQRFFLSAEYFKDVSWIKNTWSTFILEALAYRTRELEHTLEHLPSYEDIYEYSLDDARHIEETGVIAWRESDQGWSGLFCKDGKSYFRCTEPNDIIKLPCDRRTEIRSNKLPGWQCYYCGLGHRVMIRKEFYPAFDKLTYGGGKQHLWNIAFVVLSYILSQERD